MCIRDSYSVGPQFVQSLRKEGLPQILFSTLVCLACLLVSWVAALIAGFDIGNAAGLLAGGNTISAVIGVASDTIAVSYTHLDVYKRQR